MTTPAKMDLILVTTVSRVLAKLRSKNLETSLVKFYPAVTSTSLSSDISLLIWSMLSCI